MLNLVILQQEELDLKNILLMVVNTKAVTPQTMRGYNLNLTLVKRSSPIHAYGCLVSIEVCFLPILQDQTGLITFFTAFLKLYGHHLFIIVITQTFVF